MLSIPDMALLGAAALLLFGPEQLPKVLRKVGQVTRDVQNTSQSFIREMERAADEHDAPRAPYEPAPYDVPPYVPEPYDATPAHETTAPPHVEEPDLAEPDPERPVGEKLAEPRPAIDKETPPPEPWDYPTQPMRPVSSQTAESPPEPDHPAHV